RARRSRSGRPGHGVLVRAGRIRGAMGSGAPLRTPMVRRPAPGAPGPLASGGGTRQGLGAADVRNRRGPREFVWCLTPGCCGGRLCARTVSDTLRESDTPSLWRRLCAGMVSDTLRESDTPSLWRRLCAGTVSDTLRESDTPSPWRPALCEDGV